MRIIALAVVLVTFSSGQVSAGNCNFFTGARDCSGFQTFAWIATAPVWLPLTVVYVLLGGELPEQTAKRQENERRAQAAWNGMTATQRQEVIQLKQLQVIQEAAKSQQDLQLLNTLRHLQQPAKTGHTSCTPDMMGGFDCHDW